MVQIDHDGVAFPDLITAVKAAVKRANLPNDDANGEIRVTQFTVSAAIAATRAVGGGLELRVPVAGLKLGGRYARTRADTRRIEITLVPPEPQKQIEVRDGAVEQALIDGIATVRTALSAAAGGADPFVLKTSTVVLEFVVTDTGSVKLIGEGDLADESTHTLTLTLGPT